MNNTVYVTQNPMRRDPVTNDLVYAFDLTSARRYGELRVLLASGPPILTPGPLIEQLREKLTGFTDRDYLLCLGDPVVIAMASAIVSEVNDGVVPLLVWDRRVKAYNAVTVDIYRRLAATI